MAILFEGFRSWALRRFACETFGHWLIRCQYPKVKLV